MKRLFALPIFVLALLFVAPWFAYSAPANLQSLCYTTNGNNCVAGIQASNSLPINIAASTTTEIIALVAGKKIYITSWDVIAGGNVNVTLKYGTGTACGTGTASLTGAYPLVAQAGISKGDGMGIVLIVPAGNALCVTTDATSQISGSVSYAQF